MTERDDNVYKAKLAEQAERYDGTWSNLGNFYPQTSPFRRVKGVAMASARSLTGGGVVMARSIPYPGSWIGDQIISLGSEQDIWGSIKLGTCLKLSLTRERRIFGIPDFKHWPIQKIMTSSDGQDQSAFLCIVSVWTDRVWVG